MQNVVNWFEIPAADFDRAVSFYSTVLGVEITKGEFMGESQAFFPADATNVSGAIVKSDRLTPSTTGTLIYLNLGTVANLDAALERVTANGGKTLMGKTDIGDPGFIGLIQDTEGNNIGLHAFHPPKE
ncbi:MAG TPA: VOC family protein [Chroococcidiopsis sp.]